MTSEAEATAACLKSLPSKIKIGPYDWTIVLQDTEEALLGQTWPGTCNIALWPKNLTSAAQVVGIVLHECSHVIFENQGLSHLKRDKEEREEQIVCAYEAGMIGLFRDNPKLLTWMKKWLR